MKVNSKTLVGAVPVAFCMAMLFSGTASNAEAAGITVYEDGDKYVKMGGRIQVQYHSEEEDNEETVDDLFFRRLRPYIEGSVHKVWKGKFQWDMGKAEDDDEIAIKDAYLQYKGLSNMDVTIGNANFPFSRELLTSSKYQQLVERTFVGDHNYGTPDRQLGVHLTGHALEKKLLTWGFSAASASIDPDRNKLDFDTPVNRDSDFNEGWILGGRIDFHPFGELKMSQGDFKRDETQMTIGLAAFTWNNDDDNNTRTNDAGQADDDPSTAAIDSTKKPDMDRVTGFEVSAALRVAGLSVDAEYNIFNAETVNSTYTGGMYKDGETDLKTYALEAGYMIIPDTVELVAGYEMMDADNYEDEWTRTSVGANWFFKKHDIKLQATYRMGENINGSKDTDMDEFFLQAQYVF